MDVILLDEFLLVEVVGIKTFYFYYCVGYENARYKITDVSLYEKDRDGYDVYEIKVEHKEKSDNKTIYIAINIRQKEKRLEETITSHVLSLDKVKTMLKATDIDQNKIVYEMLGFLRYNAETLFCNSWSNSQKVCYELDKEYTDNLGGFNAIVVELVAHIIERLENEQRNIYKKVNLIHI